MIMHPHPPSTLSLSPQNSKATTLLSNSPTLVISKSQTMADLQHGFSRNYENYGCLDGGGVELRPRSEGEDESGPPSPTLWNTSPARSIEPEASLLHHSSHSSASRTHAIARSQRELMEMIQNMPESSYELSLQDLVERPNGLQVSADTKGNESKTKTEKPKRKKGQDSKKGRSTGRSVSREKEPVLLKTFLPLSLGAMKKSFSMDTSSKMTKKCPSLETKGRAVDKEWWKKRYSVAGDSDSAVTTSNNSGSTGSSGSNSIGSKNSSSRRRRKFDGLADCCPCFQTMDRNL